MGPTGNYERGEFEGKISADLEWIKDNIQNIQKMCMDRGIRLANCEASLCATREILKKFDEYGKKFDTHEERIKDCEKNAVQIRTVGSLLVVIWGVFVSYFGSMLWGK